MRQALVLHMEAGTCASGMTRRQVDELVRLRSCTRLTTCQVARYDRNNVITNPNRMITGNGSAPMPMPQSMRLFATEQSYDAYSNRYKLCVVLNAR